MGNSDKAKHGEPRIEVRTEWINGARTPAWDELWRRILEEVLPSNRESDEPKGGRENYPTNGPQGDD